MPKGKKFDAAEKHFQKKEQELRKRIKFKEDLLIELNEEWNKLRKENQQLKKENEKLTEAINQLMKTQNLSEEDVQALLAHTKHLNEVYEVMKAVDGVNVIPFRMK